MYQQRPSDPILVFFKSQTCTHCNNLAKKWNDIVKAIKTKYPSIRTTIVTALNNKGDLPPNAKPKSITKFGGLWFPLIFLFPGIEWDKAMLDDNYQLGNGVQIMNARYVNGKAFHHYLYNTNDPEAFVKWIEKALEDPLFKQYQENRIETNLTIPTRSRPDITNSENEKIENPERDVQNSEQYIRSGIKRFNENNIDICSMRIIPRYK